MTSNGTFKHFGLREAQRYTTTNDASGKSVFNKIDGGDFEATMGDGRVARIDLFASNKFPINMMEDADITYSAKEQVGSSYSRTGSASSCTISDKFCRQAFLYLAA